MDFSQERPELRHEPAWVRWLFEIQNTEDDWRLVTRCAARDLERWFAR